MASNVINVYSANEINFNNNGLVVLSDCKTAFVEEMLNDKYEATIEHIIDSRGKWKYLVDGNILKIEGQLFRIYNTTLTLAGIMVSVRHIFYDLLNNFVETCTITNLNNAAVTWEAVNSNQYASAGTFTVAGTVQGTSLTASATITVINSSDYIKTGLVMYLSGKDFSNSPPTSLWIDRSASGNNGTAYGFAYTTSSGSDGAGGVKGDGISSYIDCGLLPSSDLFTLELKLNYRGTDNKVFHLLDRNSNSDQWAPFGLCKDSNTYINLSMGNADHQLLFNMSDINPGDVLTLSGNWPNVRVYKNGVYLRTMTFSQHFTNNATNKTMLFRAGEYATYYADSDLGYIRYYVGYALSDAEVLRNYNVGDSV
ncbi:MAG: Ig-like domain-containing protein [Desulfosporosinus sp.]|nr:Ig-like domain-containing protein [Desulfosporosinus sp.]